MKKWILFNLLILCLLSPPGLSSKGKVQKNISLLVSDKSVYAIMNHGAKIKYEFTGESVNRQKAYGNMALVLTTKNILGIHTRLDQWAIYPIEGDSQFESALGENIIIVLSDRRGYALSLNSSEWKSISLQTNQTFKPLAEAKDSVGGIFTDRYIYAFSFDRDSWHSFMLYGQETVKAKLFNKIISCATNRRNIIFNGEKGEFQVLPLE